MLVIKNGKIVTMDGRLIDGGDILVNENKIFEIRDNTNYEPNTSDVVIDAKKSYVFPGFIDAYTHCGLEGGIGDIYNRDMQLFPQNQTSKYINVKSSGFFDRVKNGITSVAVAPFDYHIVGGKSCIVKTAPDENNQLNIVSDFCYEKISFNIENEQIAPMLLNECFSNAKSFLSQGNKGRSQSLLCEYKPVLYDNKPCFISVKNNNQLKFANRFIEQFSLNGVIILSGSFDESEGVELPQNLAYVFTPFGATPSFRRQFANELALGIEDLALSASETMCCYDMLTINAGIMVHDGLDVTKTLNSITTIPAKLCNVEDRIGCLKEGLDADIVICDSNPLEISSVILYTIIDGRIAYRC